MQVMIYEFENINGRPTTWRWIYQTLYSISKNEKLAEAQQPSERREILKECELLRQVDGGRLSHQINRQTKVSWRNWLSSKSRVSHAQRRGLQRLPKSCRKSSQGWQLEIHGLTSSGIHARFHEVSKISPIDCFLAGFDRFDYILFSVFAVRLNASIGHNAYIFPHKIRPFCVLPKETISASSMNRGTASRGMESFINIVSAQLMHCLHAFLDGPQASTYSPFSNLIF